MEELITKYLQYLRIERNSSVHTLTAYKKDLLQLLEFTSKTYQVKPSQLQAGQVDRLTIRLWMGNLSEMGIARNSIARKTAAVRSFFKYCYKRGYTDKNPAHLLIVPKNKKRLPATAPAADIQKMIELADGEEPEILQDRAVLELFYSTGIRLSELIQLNVPDLDFSSGQLSVHGKGNKQRIVPVGKHAQTACKNHLKTRSQLFTSNTDSDAKKALFIAPRGRRINPVKVQRTIRSYFTRASETSQKSPHTLRHSFATHMLDAGADIRIIKEFLGHADLSSTQIYTHTSMERLQKIYTKAHPRAESKIQY